MKSTDFIVARHDLQQCKVIETELPDAAALPDEALLVRVDRFAFTANNITYAVLGDALKYWQLFPAPQGFGNVPVWGFGEVIVSRHPDIAVGERLFGYFPMATHLVIEAADVLAHLLHTLRKDIKVIGLTSASNVAFVKSLGCYDEIVAYDRVTSLPPDSPVAYVDMAGNSELRATLHGHFGDQMKYSGRVGLTHRSSSPDEPVLPGAKPTWFSAPDTIRKRAKEWGPGGIEARFGPAWAGFVPMLDRWLKVTEGNGSAAVRQIYLDTLNGRVPPDQGHILSLRE